METEQKSDLRIFIPEDNEVTTVDGAKVKIPKLSWKKELALIEIIKKSMDEIVENSGAVPEDAAALVNIALRVVPHNITKFMATVMDKSEDWVQDSLDSTEIIGVILPLLKSRFDLIATKLKPFLGENQENAVQFPPSLVGSSKTIQ